MTMISGEGLAVQQGEVIATVGMSGRATAPHLHFEMHLDDQPQDPMQYIKF